MPDAHQGALHIGAGSQRPRGTLCGATDATTGRSAANGSDGVRISIARGLVSAMSAPELSAAVTEFTSALGADAVLTDPASLREFGGGLQDRDNP